MKMQKYVDGVISLQQNERKKKHTQNFFLCYKGEYVSVMNRREQRKKTQIAKFAENEKFTHE